MLQTLDVVICSTRPTRVGPAVAHWFHDHARQAGGFEARLIDLADFGLPVFDEPNHPQLGKYVHAHTKRWAESVSQADAFAFVAPEYNHGPTPALVNALAYLCAEWEHKPAGFVCYGGRSGGLRGVQVTKLIVSALQMVPTKAAVVVHDVKAHIEDGTFRPPEGMAKEADGLLKELQQMAGALAPLRKKPAAGA